MDKELRLTHEEAAAYLEITPATLANWRYEGKSPPYIKLHSKKIIYTKKDLDAWIEGKKNK